jgi:hypothetical protein
MTPMQQFTEWRDELTLELAEVLETLAAERARLAAADTAYSEARAAHQALQQFAKEAFKDNAVAGPLHSRLMGAGDAVRAPKGERGAALASVAAVEARMAALRDAITQIDGALTIVKVTELRRPAAEPSRRKPVPVDYDTIVLPREAAS